MRLIFAVIFLIHIFPPPFHIIDKGRLLKPEVKIGACFVHRIRKDAIFVHCTSLNIMEVKGGCLTKAKVQQGFYYTFLSLHWLMNMN